MIMHVLPLAALASAGLATAQAPSGQPPTAPSAVPQIPTRVTARFLANLCAQNREGCITYVLGAADAFASALVASGRPQAFCPPRGTTNAQMTDVSVTYLRNHPEEAGSNGALVVLAALQSAYPCGR